MGLLLFQPPNHYLTHWTITVRDYVFNFNKFLHVWHVFFSIKYINIFNFNKILHVWHGFFSLKTYYCNSDMTRCNLPFLAALEGTACNASLILSPREGLGPKFVVPFGPRFFLSHTFGFFGTLFYSVVSLIILVLIPSQIFQKEIQTIKIISKNFNDYKYIHISKGGRKETVCPFSLANLVLFNLTKSLQWTRFRIKGGHLKHDTGGAWAGGAGLY